MNNFSLTERKIRFIIFLGTLKRVSGLSFAIWLHMRTSGILEVILMENIAKEFLYDVRDYTQDSHNSS